MPVRIDKNMLDDDDDDAGIEDGVVEETIDFLKTIEMARREVFEAEREREKYEIKYQVRSLHTRCISDFYREYLNFFCIYAGVKHVLIIDFFLSNTHPHIHSHSSIGTPPLSPPSHTRSTYPYVGPERYLRHKHQASVVREKNPRELLSCYARHTGTPLKSQSAT